ITGTEPFAEFGAEVVEFLSRFELRLSDEHRIRLNFGAFKEGQAVHGQGPLAVDPVDTNQPYFLLDIDSFWEARSFEEYDADRILEISDDLHRPVRSLFETSITDRLRDQVLRKAP
ncbi:MAG: TIGR04255 family protein, partial [Acidobacteria bacterium]|nr:TIGR04255 family protein [Acidobacteriota bacterium]